MIVINKQLKKISALFFLYFLFFLLHPYETYAIPEDQMVLITEIDKTETSTSLLIKAADDIDSIRLPDGNWVLGATTPIYSVNRNGTYDFVCKLKNGRSFVKSYTVSELRQNVLITNERTVKLLLSSTDLLSGLGFMKFRNEKEAWSEYETFATEKEWTLSDEEGLKKIYVTFKDIAGNETIDTYDQIYYDISGPTVKFEINNGDEYCNRLDVALQIYAIDNFSDVEYLLVSNDGINYKKVKNKEEISWRLEGEAGEKTVYLKAVDGVGNESSVVTDTIFFDNIPPKGSISINNGNAITNSRNVKLQFAFNDEESKVKRVTIYEGNKSYTFDTLPNSPSELDWTLSLGESAMVTLEIEDYAGNIYRTNSNTITIVSLKITEFTLTEIINPSEYEVFYPLTWDFEAQPMVSGAKIGFEIKYHLDLSEDTSANIEGKYTLEIIGDNYYKVIHLPYNTKILNGFKTALTLPLDAPIGSKIYLSSTITATLTKDDEIFKNESYFPDISEKALIGYIKSSIQDDLKFNEIS